MSLAAACTSGTFAPTLFGAEILSVQASLVTNYNQFVDGTYRRTQPSIDVKDASFCNVTVTYTHPGQNDNIIVEAWLPVDNWNQRFQAVGGGGWNTGRTTSVYYAMAGAIGDGYATITTDAGLGTYSDPSPWILLSPGNVNMYYLQNFATSSLGDEAILGKGLIKDFYGEGPLYSYWNGCSTGGRQGLTLAQRYPDAYDGIAAGAPVIYWTRVGMSNIWPQQYMNMENFYPYGCELEAITAAAVTACDGLDGVVDGLISDPDTCVASFDPTSLVGSTIDNCTQTGGPITISAGAAKLASALWDGSRTVAGDKIWFGLSIGSDLTMMASTNCSTGTCVGSPGKYGWDLFRYFVAKDPKWESDNISHETYEAMGHSAFQQWQSAMDFDDPDISGFRNAGGKLITYHGMADNLIPAQGTDHYYQLVSDLFPDVDDFYRHFPIPGLGHCSGGRGGQPSGMFAQLRAWVENGTAPEHSSMKFTALDGTNQTRILCPFPKKPFYNGHCGNSSDSTCWTCVKRGEGSTSPTSKNLWHL